jgi:hypothetical protein
MSVERLIRTFAGSFVLASLALGVQASPVFVNENFENRRFKPPFSPCATISPGREAVNRAVFGENPLSRAAFSVSASTRGSRFRRTLSVTRKRGPGRIVSPVEEPFLP